MDLILLPPPIQRGELLTPVGETRLESLISWFLDHGTFVRLYAYVPAADEERRWLLEFLKGAGRKFGVEIAALLDPAHITWDLVEALHTRGVVDLIICVNSGELAAGLAAVALVDRYRAERTAAARPDVGLSCRVWLEPGNAGDDFQRLSRLALSAPWLTIEESGFAPAAEALVEPVPLPNALQRREGGCWLYHKSLTVDAAGRVWMCPRHTGGPAEGRTGDLFANSPDELMIAKENGSARLGRTAACRRCGLRGRFQWPEPPRTRPGLPTADSDRVRSGTDRPTLEALTPEVDAGDAVASLQAIEAFEARRASWSARLEDWELESDS
jgi:hypothetical protein